MIKREKLLESKVFSLESNSASPEKIEKENGMKERAKGREIENEV